MAQKWPRILSTADLTSSFDGKVTDTGTWLQNKIKVPAQQVIKFGTGAIVNGVDNRGILYLSVKDNTSETPVQVEGKFRLAYLDANEVRKVVIVEGHTSDMHSSTTARNAANTLGETGPGARQDSYLLIEFLPDTASKTLELDNCSFKIPVTIYTA